ncbi:MAG: hypothetical protein KKC75_06040 [Nanoarchaeota archaeon]|nr:hypothetical protein [Nanoarchaeota archaeon]MBU1004706.1 hypothetical protein [Nanoarchaeota archaeon]MBU1945752.1 hypothetical protein [Nanoarchaeota archaeon]
MGISKQDDGTYKVDSESSKGKFYTVDLNRMTCTCPHFRTRLQRIHGMCKHMEAVKDKFEGRDSESYENIIAYVKSKWEVDSIELIKKFSEEAVDDLISRGELIEYRGKIRILS